LLAVQKKQPLIRVHFFAATKTAEALQIAEVNDAFQINRENVDRRRCEFVAKNTPRSLFTDQRTACDVSMQSN